MTTAERVEQGDPARAFAKIDPDGCGLLSFTAPQGLRCTAHNVPNPCHAVNTNRPFRMHAVTWELTEGSSWIPNTGTCQTLVLKCLWGSSLHRQACPRWMCRDTLISRIHALA